MDNFQIEKCARIDSRYLGRVFAGCLLTDDINKLLESSVNGLRLFLANTLLQRIGTFSHSIRIEYGYTQERRHTLASSLF